MKRLGEVTRQSDATCGVSRDDKFLEVLHYQDHTITFSKLQNSKRQAVQGDR